MMLALNGVPLRDFYNRAADIIIPVIPNVFTPDIWTKTFATGLQHEMDRNAFSNGHILEVGIGTGINPAGFITTDSSIQKFTGVDISNQAVWISGLTLSRLKTKTDILIQKSDLLTDVQTARLQDVTHIAACIPQVAFKGNLEEGDNSAHYYIADGNEWDRFHLGLISRLLTQSIEATPQAKMILNFSGRPGKELVDQFITAHNYRPELIHEAVVAQHSGTTLQPLADVEKVGDHEFEFFSDKAGAVRISATEAESRRVAQEPVYHKLYVMRATPSSNNHGIKLAA